jgi:hypothetical protein
MNREGGRKNLSSIYLFSGFMFIIDLLFVIVHAI